MIRNDRNDNVNNSLTSAEEYFKFLKKECNIDYKILNVSDDRDPYPTYTCGISTKDRIIMGGHGKGIGDQSIASAYYEAIEHLIFEPYYMLKIDKDWERKYIDFLSIEKIVNSENNLLDSVVFINLKEQSNKNKYPCIKFESRTTDNIIYCPIVALSPSYPYPTLLSYDTPSVYTEDNILLFSNDNMDNYKDLYNVSKYSSSNGGATGKDKDEAYVHAINELIERDAYSLFLLDVFANKNKDNYCLVNSVSLPMELRTILNFIEEKYKTNVLIIDISSDIGVPSIAAFAYPERDFQDRAYAGFGTSLNRSYAIQRAILELKQCIDLDPMLKDMNLLLEKIPEQKYYRNFHKSAYSFNPEMFITNPTKTFNDINNLQINFNNLTESADYLTNRLLEKGLEIYDFTINIDNSDIYMSHVIVPGMEELLPSYHVKFPSKRGLNMINNKQSNEN